MKELEDLHKKLEVCRRCPGMCGTPVHGRASKVSVMLIGQAPGPHEADRGRPFAHTAGKTLFQWLGSATSMNEEELRQNIYFAAVNRCYPGKNKSGNGDRVPDKLEIENCRDFLEQEVSLLKPKIIIPVGQLAIREVLGTKLKLNDLIGKRFFINYHGHPVHVIPLPHSSGISRWFKQSPGKELLEDALKLLGKEWAKIGPC